MYQNSNIFFGKDKIRRSVTNAKLELVFCRSGGRTCKVVDNNTGIYGGAFVGPLNNWVKIT